MLWQRQQNGENNVGASSTGTICDHFISVFLFSFRQTLEVTYAISIRKPKEGEDPHRPPTDLEILNAYGGK